MLGPRLADCDERRCFRQAVHVDDVPAELTFHPTDRRCGWWRARGKHLDALGHVTTPIGWRGPGEADEHGRRRAQRGHVLVSGQLEDEHVTTLCAAPTEIGRAHV